ncbi:hypothetical protein RB213_005970 [Colletotrichum asianum]
MRFAFDAESISQIALLWTLQYGHAGRRRTHLGHLRHWSLGRRLNGAMASPIGGFSEPAAASTSLLPLCQRTPARFLDFCRDLT